MHYAKPNFVEMKKSKIPKSILILPVLKATAFSVVALGCLAFAKSDDHSPPNQLPTVHSMVPTDFGYDRYTGPIDSSQTKQAIAQFKTDYITDAGLNYAPVNIKMNSALKRVFTLFPADEQSGMTFHYALSDDKKELSYIVAPGTHLQSTGASYYRPFPPGMHNQTTDHYILLAKNGSNAVQYISQSQFCQLTDNYKMNMKRLSGGSYVPIQNDSLHPLYVYHSGKELNLFLETYIKGAPLHLYIEHGAMIPTGSTKEYHAACFLFGDDRGSFPLNNVNYKSAGLDNPYQSKAMDIGHLSPPNVIGTPPRSDCQ